MSADSTPELSRPIDVSRIAAAGETVVVEAKPAERAALAVRFGIPAIGKLSVTFRLTAPRGQVVPTAGRMSAEVTQVCVVTLEPFETTIEEAFDVLFVPAGTETEDDLGDPDAPDEIPYDGDRIDLGEAAAEQLALALDPYPRKPGAVLDENGDETAPSPFSGLTGRFGRS
jgi:uncharacterized metal-binding protein YceD (DUF177 family)